jgi:hypothetical protein
MTNRIFKSLGAASLIALFTVAASPSSAAEISANVPFSFSVNGADLPPGVYTLSTGGTQGTVLVRGATGAAFAIGNRLEDRRQDDCKLVFHKYGDTYILRQVWTGGGTGRELPRTQRERDLAERKMAGDAQPVIVAAQ